MYSIDDLLYLMARLRDPDGGCPWDLDQNYASIAPSTIEEAYEVVDAIETGDLDHLREELGDLLFQVIFYSQLAREEQRFDFPRIVSDLVAKLVRRHPHVFPDGELYGRTTQDAADSPDVKARWEAIKQEERAAKGATGALDDVPLNLPALTRAAKLQKRASRVGFDWPDVHGPIAKVREELAELDGALAGGDAAAAEEEYGDLLFAAANIGRHLKIDPETALRRASRKFERRFRHMEAHSADGLDALDRDRLEDLWRRAKAEPDNVDPDI